MRYLPAVLVIAIACGGSKPAAQQPPLTQPAPTTIPAKQEAAPAAPKIGVALEVSPEEADVAIDDLVVGKASQLDPVFALAPGLHTLVITHPNYKTYRMEFSVTDKVENFVIHLDPKK